MSDSRKQFEKMPNPTEDDLNNPIFNAIWNVTKTWDVNIPEYYGGYCGFNGSHVKIILNAIQAATEQQQSVIDELVEALEDAERLLLESAKPFDSGCMKIKEALAKVKGVKSE